MSDVLTKKQRSFNMSMIRSKDTKPEKKLRKKLYSSGLRGYRCNYNLLGKPDIVFPAKKIAIFVDGCFWHKCPKCFQKPATNKAFWVKKLSANVMRDKKVNLELKKQGWLVLRFWEHDITGALNRCSNQIYKALKTRVA